MPSANEPTIDCRELSKHFHDRKRGLVRAVDGISFQARAGEVFGLLGINGAGKTTTLRLLATLLRPSGGDARVAGFSINERPAAVRANIGFLTMSTGLYGRLTVREMIEYFGRLHGLERERLARRTEELFERFDIASFAGRRCDKLSSGMKQKVSIVRCVLHDPAVMILDEPTASLDVLAARNIVEFIADSRSRGKCVLLSTHSMAEAEKLCDRVGVIHRGRLLACDGIAALRGSSPSGRLEDAFVKLVEERAS
ncbi:MAG: ABC transporter ATP-binding protein [Deltaproteobacteria bacterium]|nr:MAG: ABC transporter ATP-binding protein [Deltaproteobacteria bacterium]